MMLPLECLGRRARVGDGKIDNRHLTFCYVYDSWLVLFFRCWFLSHVFKGGCWLWISYIYPMEAESSHLKTYCLIYFVEPSGGVLSPIGYLIVELQQNAAS